MKNYQFEVYTYFGRTLALFEVGAGETHHSALEAARAYLLDAEKQGVTCWIRS
jgi:hypothetical protein